MNFDALIHVLIARGIKLIPQRGGRLDVDGPAKSLTPELIAALLQHKPTILHRMAAIERSEPEPVCRRLDRLIFAEGEV